MRIGSDCSLSEQGPGWLFVPDKHDSEASRETEDEESVVESMSNASINHSVESSTSPSSGGSNHIADLRFTGPERDNLRLMHHYTIHTSKTIRDITIPKHEDQSLWEAWAPELAMEHDFLLHGLLSISALHLSLCGTDPREQKRMTVTAIRHHNRAVALFRLHLDHMPATDHDAVFAMFCVVVLYSFGLHRSEGTPVERIHQVLTLLRGSMTIAKGDYERMRRSRWSGMRPPLHLDLETKLPDEMEDAISALRRRAGPAASVSTEEKETGEEAAYREAIETLRYNLIISDISPFTAPTLTWFPMASPAGYWDLLRAGRPLALGIIANYAVILHRQRSNIWMRDWGKEVVDAVREALPADWQECIAWADREVERE